MNLPSKELLAKILSDRGIKSIYEIKLYADELHFITENKNTIINHYNSEEYILVRDSINIYELAFKTKEWAYSKGYYIESGIYYDNTKIYGAKVIKYQINLEEWFSADTEQKAIFKAGEWILKREIYENN